MHLQLLTELLNTQLILVDLKEEQHMVLVALIAMASHEFHYFVLEDKHSVITP